MRKVMYPEARSIKKGDFYRNKLQLSQIILRNIKLSLEKVNLSFQGVAM